MDVELVARVAVRQGPISLFRSALRRIFGGDEFFQLLVGRTNIVIYRRDNTVGKPLFVDARNAVAKVQGGGRERVLFACGIGDFATLQHCLFEQISWRHQLVPHALPHGFGQLVETVGNLVQAGDVVFVVLGGIERGVGGDLRDGDMDAVKLIDGHFVHFEIEGFQLVFERPFQQRVIECIAFIKLRGIERFQPSQKNPGVFPDGCNAGDRVIGKFIVIFVFT